METYNSTKQQLLNAVVPISTKTYKCIENKQLIDLTLNAIDKAGFKLDKESYSSAREGQIANGRFTIANVADKEMQLEVGFQNSYDKSLSAKFAIGTRILICKNGSVRGDFGSFKKKHQGTIQEFVPSAITEYIKKAGDIFKLMQEEREKMKQVEVDKTVTAHILGEMFLNEEFITTTQLNIIKREIEMPSYDYGADGSLWQLYNHTTASLREIHPSLYMKNHMNAHSYFVNKLGVLLNDESNTAFNIIQKNELELI